LKVAQDLSERLGAYTYRAQSSSRPTLFGRGHRSTSESDQRRLLRLPQELLQMRSEELIVLKAGLPPVRGRKIVYYRERVFRRRLCPPPALPVLAMPADAPAEVRLDPLTLVLTPDEIAAAADVVPLPPVGASPEAVAAWVDRYVDAMAQPAIDPAAASPRELANLDQDGAR
jgi:type IV secretion system protein VirD4